MGERQQAASHPAMRRRARHEGRTFVYLAVLRADGSEAGGRFKIGVAIDPRERLKALPENPRIDWRASTQRALPTPSRAREVEAALHKALQPVRISPGHRASGYTEWFDIAGLATARLMLDTLPDTLQEDAWKPQARPTAGPQAPSGRSKRLRHARQPHDLRVCAANQRQLRQVRELWLRLARMAPMQVHTERGDLPARLVLVGFKEGVLPPGHRLRMLAMGSQAIYQLHLPCGVEPMPCSLVTRVQYGRSGGGEFECCGREDGGAGRQDLQIYLQPTKVLERLPDGPAIVTTLRAVLDTVAAMVTAREQGWLAAPSARPPAGPMGKLPARVDAKGRA